MMIVWILLGLLVLAIVWVIGAYNGLVSLKNRTDEAWSDIDVQLKRRYDLIPNLVEVVKDYMSYEQETLRQVIEARNRAQSANTGAVTHESLQAEGALSGALGRLFALSENYPNLKADGNVQKLMEELTGTENKIAFARQLYNDTATQYNTRQRQIPAVFIAGMAGASPVDLWEIEDATERAAPKVEL